MNLQYMKVSLFEISYKKKITFSRHSNLLRCTCSLVQMCRVSHSRQSLFTESCMRSIISSSVLKSDVSERNSSRFSVLVIRKPLQPVLDSRTRTALTGTLHARAVYLLCSCSSSVLFHTNSIYECVIINYNYSTGIS